MSFDRGKDKVVVYVHSGILLSHKKELMSFAATGFPCGSAGKESTCNVGDLGLTPGLGRSTREKKGYPLQYSAYVCIDIIYINVLYNNEITILFLIFHLIDLFNYEKSIFQCSSKMTLFSILLTSVMIFALTSM